MLARAPGKWIAARISPLVRSLLGALVWALPIGLGLLLCLESPPLVERLRNLVFDYDQQVEPRRYSPDLPVRVVDIDDSSLARLGQWPWPRHRLADLARHLFAQGATVVAFDILFSEQDRAAPQNLIAQLPDVPEREALGDALAARGLMQDDSLAKVLASGPSVLTLVLTNGNSDEVPLKTGFATLGDDPRPFLLNFRGAILPLPELRKAAAGLGSINWAPDRDLIVRKVPLVFTQGANGALVPSLDAEILRVAQHASTILIKSSNASDTGGFGARTGVVGIKIGALEIATESDGAVRVHYAGTKPARHISAWRVLAGKVANDRHRRTHHSDRLQRQRARRHPLDAARSRRAGRRHPCRTSGACAFRHAARTARLCARARSAAARSRRRHHGPAGTFHQAGHRRHRAGALA